ncbi:MAG: hypothetical protein WCS56_01595 [Bacilli bacterium]
MYKLPNDDEDYYEEYDDNPDDEDYYENKSELEISLDIAKNGLYVSPAGRIIGAYYQRVNK